MKTRVLAFVYGLIVVAAPMASAQSHLPSPQHHDRWMGELFEQAPAAQDLTLARFIFPGTHDSGTYNLSPFTACLGCSGDVPQIVKTCESVGVPFPTSIACDEIRKDAVIIVRNWGTAQHLTIGGQLRAGARYLDLRFFRATVGDALRSDGVLLPGHYYIHHALAGPESSVVLDDIAAFLAEPGHEQEVLLLSFGGMKEADGDMGGASLRAFFDQVRQRIGPYMAPRPDPACGAGIECPASARLGAATTIRELLAQGTRVVAMCDCSINAADMWDPIDSESPYFVQDLEPPAGDGGYPAPDDTQFPWASDAQIAALLDRMSQERDRTSKNKMWGLGIQFGLDDGGAAIIRSVHCRLDPDDVGGICPAPNHDWDHFRGLSEIAAYSNPMTLGALAKVRRDRLNIISGDHYSELYTDEVFKLNGGATLVELRIDTVREITKHDPTGDPDFYPVFLYPEVTPLPLQARVERNLQAPNSKTVALHWPGYKSYPNAWGTAKIGFSIYDADGAGDDDVSHINLTPGEGTTVKFTDVLITGCVTSRLLCPALATPHVTIGAGNGGSRVTYSIGACLWSWLPGDEFDAASDCGEGPPDLSVSEVHGGEGDSDTRTFEFAVTLSAPSLTPVTVHYRTAPADIVAGSSIVRATTGEDYEEIADGLLTFAPFETRKTVTVKVKGDTKVEPDEWFALELFSAAGAIAVNPKGRGKIIADDVAYVSIGDVTRAEGHAGSTAFTFPMTLSAPSTRSITVHAKTADGTAIASSDYTALLDTLVTFAPGVTSRTVTVQVAGDPTQESNETFSVFLQQVSNAVIGDDEGVGTITNDDVPATLTAPASQSGHEGASLVLRLGTLTDPRAAGPWSIDVNWGDSHAETFSVGAAGLLSRHYTYADSGSYTVTVTAADTAHVASNTVTFAVTVANVNPTAALTNGGPINEGGATAVAFAGGIDPSGADTAAGLHYAFSCTGRALSSATYAASSASPTLSCPFPDSGARTVRARVIDKDGGFTEYTTAVTVNNVAPSLTTPPPQASVPGSSASFSLGTLADPGADTPWTVTVDWGDTRSESFKANVVGALARSHVYASDGTYHVVVVARDKDGASSSPASFLVTASTLNRAPECAATQPSQASIVATPHAFVGVTLRGVTDADGDPIQLSISAIRQDEPVLGVTDGDVGPDAGGIGTATALLRSERADAGDGRVYHIAFTASDGRGGSCDGSVTVGVRKNFASAVDGGPLFDSTTAP